LRYGKSGFEFAIRSAWVFSASFPKETILVKKESPLWHITSSNGTKETTHDLKSFFAQHKGEKEQPTYTIEPKGNKIWKLETTFELHQDAMHIQSELSFEATHICIMLLPHGGLHDIKVMGNTQ
jgi:hypothetical protein